MKALYRKYRPLKLSDVIGEEQVTSVLSNSIKQGKISHAYLFIGPRGTGKTSVARIFAHEINGFSYELEDEYVDIIEIDGASNRGIDNIRELCEKAMVSPTKGKYKVYIIDEVHMLTKEAFNALLKTLEEPPKHVIFIMATTDAYKVPVTITSRAQTYTFKLADENTMFAHLKKISEAENIQIADDALRMVVRRGGGSFRDSISLLDQISTLSDKEITKEMVELAMGLPEDEKISGLIQAYSSENVVDITTLLKDLLASGVKAETIASEMIFNIMQGSDPKLFSLLAKLPEVKAPFAEAKLLATLCSSLTTVPVTQAATTYTPPVTMAQPAVTPQNINTPKTTSPTTSVNTAKNTGGAKSFDWGNFLNRVKELNDAIYSQLKKSQYTFSSGELKIYPNSQIAKTILSRNNNKKILDDVGGVKITICNKDEQPENTTKDALISKISDIMGGEVRNDGEGGNPF